MLALLIVSMVVAFLTDKDEKFARLTWFVLAGLALVVVIWRGPEAYPDSIIGAGLSLVLIFFEWLKTRKVVNEKK